MKYKEKKKKQFLIYVSRRDNTHIYRTTTIIIKKNKNKSKGREKVTLYFWYFKRDISCSKSQVFSFSQINEKTFHLKI